MTMAATTTTTAATAIVALLLGMSGWRSAAARDILPPGPVDAAVGKNVTLVTLLQNPEYSFIIWNFNDGREQIHVATVGSAGLKVNAPYLGRASVDATSGALRLSALTTGDSGDFSVSVVNADGGTETAEIRLRVLEPVSDVLVSADLAEAVEHNSTLVLSCAAKGSFLRFTWLNETEPIDDGERLSVAQSETSSQLMIARILRTDLARPIFCSAANQLDTEKSAPFSLPVHYGPDEVTVTASDPSPFVRADSDFNLTCAAGSAPAATFAWYQNETLMDSVGAVLPLEAVRRRPLWREMSQYTCRAANAKTGRVVSSPAVSFAVVEALSGALLSGPAPDAVLLAGEHSANLSCRAAAGVADRRTWLKDGRPLATDGGRVSAAPDGSWLSLAPLHGDDNGRYACRLANAVSELEAVYELLVNYGPEGATVSGESAVEVGDAVTLRCAAASVPPANFTWTFNGTLSGVETPTYAIAEAVYKNAGAYACRAHNAVTGKNASYTHRLAVKEEGTLDEGLSDGAIAGIIIGVLAALGVAVGVVLYCRQKVPVESPY
ncbi:carcinoembryonic antigen-related cell adhesion molecule 5-like [Syngnathoides biaculeatus]|uniref:carcinoembryonic antigen-related cell adhesion molecule 5-like n=1 Tax=Syngnathoides biaculeatus TaxID=300417 RepID=UPI002ADE6E98|nr:carcinoembryonic antigen-related cell adhesion molecule 5-like [Syngnathoides biaculeatus]